MKKSVYILWFFLVLALGLVACQPQATSTPASPLAVTNTPEIKPTDTVAVPATPTVDAMIEKAGDLPKGIVLDPALAIGAEELQVNGYLYRGLVQLDANGAPVADLATSWTVSDDELDIVFLLRKDAVFADGTPIDADVVVANFYRWFDPNNALHGNGVYQGWKDNFVGFLGDLDADGKPLAIVDGMEKVDSYTVLLHLNRRTADILEKLALPYFAILKPAALEAGNYGVDAKTVVSSGPYVIGAWDADQLLLEPNALYWGDKATNKIQFGWK